MLFLKGAGLRLLKCTTNPTDQQLDARISFKRHGWFFWAVRSLLNNCKFEVVQ